MSLKTENNTLQKFKEEIVKVLDEHIEKNKLNETIENVSTLEFSKIIALYEAISDKLLDTKNGCNVVKNYIKAIKESEELKNIYSIYNFINNGVNENQEECLNEALSCVKPISKKNYTKKLNELGSIVGEGLKVVNLNRSEIENILSNVNTIYEDIDYLLFNKKTLKNVNEHINRKNTIVNFLKENKKNNENIVEENVSNKDLLDNINKEMGEIDEVWLKTLFEDITINNLSNNEPLVLFEKYKKECLSKINEILENTSNVYDKSKMSTMKEGLEHKNYKEESFHDDMIKLAELKNTLNESIYED